MAFLNKMFACIGVFRLHRTINFFYLIIGLLYAGELNLNFSLLAKVVLIYLIFGILMYGGIYSLNGYIERFDDLKHPGKKHRLLPSGKVKPKVILLSSLIFITASLFLGWIFLRGLVLFQVFFLAVNLLYTFLFKKLNSYLAIVTIATTGPAKFLLGFFLVSGSLIFYIPLVHYLCSVAYHSRKFIYSGMLKKSSGDRFVVFALIVASILSTWLLTNKMWLVLIFILPALTDTFLYYLLPNYKLSTQKKWDKD